MKTRANPRTSTLPSDQQITNATTDPIPITPIPLQDLQNGMTVQAMNEMKIRLTQTQTLTQAIGPTGIQKEPTAICHHLTPLKTLTLTWTVTTSTAITQRNEQEEYLPYSSASAAPGNSHPENGSASNTLHLSSNKKF